MGMVDPPQLQAAVVDVERPDIAGLPRPHVLKEDGRQELVNRPRQQLLGGDQVDGVLLALVPPAWREGVLRHRAQGGAGALQLLDREAGSHLGKGLAAGPRIGLHQLLG